MLNPGKWVDFNSGTVVVGKNAMGQKVTADAKVHGYTNETTIETRVIDKKTLLDENSEEDTNANELKEIKKDFIRRKSEDKKNESDLDSESSENEESEEDSIKEKDVVQAIYDAEALEESNGDEED